jgi:hypothetical protein
LVFSLFVNLIGGGSGHTTPSAMTQIAAAVGHDGHSPRTGIAKRVAVTGISAMMAAAARGPSKTTARLKAKSDHAHHGALDIRTKRATPRRTYASCAVRQEPDLTEFERIDVAGFIGQALAVDIGN